MRPMRERLAQPHLTGGIDPDEAWNAAPCMDPAESWRWDLDLDSNGKWQKPETRIERRRRHKQAVSECMDCPALALCFAKSSDLPGRTGVIAGRVVT